MSEATSPTLVFFFFAAVTFILLRYIINTLARMNQAAWAGPILILLGAMAGAYFFRFNLSSQYFVWYLVLFTLVIFTWHAKSRVDEKKLRQLAGTEAGENRQNSEIVQAYTMTRRLLSFGLVSFLAAFSAAYYYLYTHP